MTVVFDLIGVQSKEHGERGIARYVLHLALEVERQAPGLVDHYLVRPGLPIPGALEPLISTGRVRQLTKDRSRLDTTEGGVFIAGSLFEIDLGWVIPQAFRASNWRRIAVLYDLIPMLFPDLYLRDPIGEHGYTAQIEAVRAIDRLLAISQATADDAVEHLAIPPSRIRMIGAGADDRFSFHPDGRDAAIADIVSSPPVDGIRAGYILNPTGLDHRKNIDGMMRAYAALPSDLRRSHQLVLALKLTHDERVILMDQAQAFGIADDLVVTGFVSDDDLVRLYRGAHLVVFPSLYEGFGLPVFEAMRCGAPVICSDSSSLREVQIDPTARFDPTDAASITALMRRLLDDDVERERIRQLTPPPFSWADCATATIECIHEQLDVPRRRRRRRVALVTPLPPQQSGIATYAARMLEHLVEADVDWTVFVDDDVESVTPIPGVEIARTDTFHAIEWAGRPFDQVVYFLGNSSFHVDAIDLLLEVGGTVLLHDVRLTGLWGEVLKERPALVIGGSVGKFIEHTYPGQFARIVGEEWIVPADMASRFGVHLLKPVVEAAHDVIVHSDFAAAVTELDTGTRPDVLFPIPGPAPVERAERPDGVQTPSIVSVGIVNPVKSPELLIEALTIVRRHVPDAELTFIGGGPDHYVDTLHALVAERGLESAVTFLGHVDDEEFSRRLQSAACAVQLRNVTNGESSAAVMDTLAAGVPTLITSIGAMAELPDDVVVHLAADVTAPELAAELVRLLADEAARDELRSRAIDYVADNGFAQAAALLLERLGL